MTETTSGVTSGSKARARRASAGATDMGLSMHKEGIEGKDSGNVCVNHPF